MLRRAGAFLVSPKLAIALLASILACCVVGVTFFRGARAWALIFSTLWFNALLVLMAVSSAAAFFSRIWRRRLTLVQAGMILFHLSFAALLCSIVVNSLFHFNGLLRLTEGETLPSDDLASYDRVEAGRFFDIRRLRGEATLLRMHTRYEVEGRNKAPAYEIAVGAGGEKTTGTLYVTRSLDHEGVRYIRAKEGYSVLVTMADAEGREIYGAHVPLQSFAQPDGSWRYGTGSPTAVEPIPFPHPPESPRFELLLTFRPNTVVERQGEVEFQIFPVGFAPGTQPVKRGRVVVGGELDAGGVTLAPKEIRYWVGMDVRHDPALPAIFTSLCAGLAGMILTFVARARQGGRRAAAPAIAAPRAPAFPEPREERG